MKILAVWMLLAVAVPLAWADVVHLKDGSRVIGDVKKGPVGYTVTQRDGKTRTIASDDVKTIELGTGGAVADTPAANEKLASLRRSVEYVDDLGKIIERYQRFIEQVAGTSVETDARQDLAGWQEKQQRGLVKFGSRWVTPAERATLQEKALRDADGARKLLRQGRLAEAESAINRALAEDPQNAAALYLRGLLEFRKDQLTTSRKTFETVNALVANHAPTLNNIAVVIARQNQVGPALSMFDQAMQASPKNKEILNNVAEFLYGMPDDQRATAIAQRVLKRFNQQDVELAKLLEKEGLHRWGANWVTTEQMTQLKAAEQQVKDKLDALAGEFDTAKVRLSNIDRDVDENNRSMRRYEAQSWYQSSSGQLIQSALPVAYYDLDNANKRLASERTATLIRLDRLREQAKAINKELPVPKYTGVLKLMDENFAPITAPQIAPPITAPQILAPQTPSTQSATAPVK